MFDSTIVKPPPVYASSLSRPQITVLNSLEHPHTPENPSTENEILIKNNLAVYLFINAVLKRRLSAPAGHLVVQNCCHMTQCDECAIQMSK